MELSDFNKDALTECVNIGIGKAAATLSLLVASPIKYSIPFVKFVRLESIKRYLDDNHSNWSCCVIIEFGGEYTGDAIVIFSKESSNRWMKAIGQAQLGVVDEFLPEMQIDVLSEIGNIILNGCMGSIANLLESTCDINLPKFFSRTDSALFDDLLEDDKTQDFGMIINSVFEVENTEMSAEIVLTFTQESMPVILDRLARISGI